jgi:hypothetical protein
MFDRLNPRRIDGSVNSIARIVVSGFVICLSVCAPAHDIVLNPRPQVSKDTCQSYQMAFALDATGDPMYQVATTKQLRQQEQQFRNALVQVANAAPGARKGDTTDHLNWQDAVKLYTNGRYVLRAKYYKTLPELYAVMAEKTGNRSVQATGAVLAAFTMRQPVFTSVSKVGSSTYGKGHIVAVLGVAYPTNQSPGPEMHLPLAILNSAIKLKKSSANMCQLEGGDDRYRAEVYLSGDYELKSFESLGYNLLWLESSQ